MILRVRETFAAPRREQKTPDTEPIVACTIGKHFIWLAVEISNAHSTKSKGSASVWTRLLVGYMIHQGFGLIPANSANGTSCFGKHGIRYHVD